MSSMLEQAIIDANMLKEAAIKTAEDSIIEKYSSEIKDAVENLLEQDEDPFDLGDEEGEMDIDVPLAATDGEDLCPCPEEEEEVELDLTDIKKELEKIEAGESSEDLGSPEPHAAAAAQMPALEENQEIEEAGMSPRRIDKSSPKLDKSSPKISPSSMGDVGPIGIGNRDDEEEEELDEEIEIDEEQLEEIIEKLVVDMEPRMSGWSGRPEKELEYEKEIGLAAMEDDDYEEGESQLSYLKEKYEELKSELVKIQESFEKVTEKETKYKETIISLKENLTVMTVSNAKLLYTNRILNSDSLNERQKSKIVEAISQVDSVEEAKVVFETLQSTVGSAPSYKREPQSLSEAVERRPTLLANRNKGSQESLPNPVRERMKKLAGI